MIAILFIVAAGYLLIFGAGTLAERALKIAAGLALILSVLPGLIAAVSGNAPSLGCQGSGDVPAVASSVGLVVLLAGVGLALWRARGLLAKRREATARRWGSPRDRSAPPPPPPDDASERSDLS